MADEPPSDPYDVSNPPLGPRPPQLRPPSFLGGFSGPQAPFQQQQQQQHQPQPPMHYYPYASDRMYPLPSPSTYPPSPAYSMMPSYGVPATSPQYTYSTPGYAPWGYYPPIQSHFTSPQGVYPSSLDESPSPPNPGPTHATPSPQPQSPYGPHSPGYSPIQHPNFSIPTTSPPGYVYSTPMYAPSPPIFTPQYAMTPHAHQSSYQTGPHATNAFGSQSSETGLPTDDHASSQPPRPPSLRQHSSQSAVQIPPRQQQQQPTTPSPGSWWSPPGYAVSYYPGAPNTGPYARQFQVPPHGAGLPVSSQAPPQLSLDPPSGQVRASIESHPVLSALSPQPLPFPLVLSPPFSPASASSGLFTVAPLPLRRFNPNPATRSEWVLWCGNVPNDATEEELLRFFRKIDSKLPPETALNVGETVMPTDVAPAASGGHNTLPRPSMTSSGSAATSQMSSVASVFLIARSNCAFINFTSEEALHKAVQKFNGKPLRKGGKAPRLVCRVRRREDDLRAGVGGQRGTGIHVQWVKEMARRQQTAEAPKEVDDPPTSPSTHFGPESNPSVRGPSPQGHPGEDEPKERPAPVPLQSGDSGKSQSTTSSLLVKHFPKRYFILKSLTQFDLDLSVQRGLWATQPHNEPILDQAYRTSTAVYLIFGVNKSGEFFGYARMDSRIFSDGQRPSVEWAARDTTVSARTSPRLQTSPVVEVHRSEAVNSVARPPATPTPNLSSGEYLLTPELDHPPVTSPDPITPADVIESTVSQPNPPISWSLLTNLKPAAQRSAPAEMGRPHDRLSASESPQSTGTWDEVKKQRLQAKAKAKLEDTLEGIGEETPLKYDQESEVGEMLPEENWESLQRPPPRTARTAPPLAVATSLAGTTLVDLVSEQQTFVERAPGPLGDAAPGGGAAGGRGWGAPFKVQWVRTDPLSFLHTKHLKNPWNGDREIKVSRDGTEVEPTIGQMLIDEWEKIELLPGLNQAGGTVKSPTTPTTPLPRSTTGRARSMRNAPGTGSWPSRVPRAALSRSLEETSKEGPRAERQ